MKIKLRKFWFFFSLYEWIINDKWAHIQSMHSHPFICVECGIIASMWGMCAVLLRPKLLIVSVEKRAKSKLRRHWVWLKLQVSCKAGWSTFAFCYISIYVTAYDFKKSWYCSDKTWRTIFLLSQMKRKGRIAIHCWPTALLFRFVESWTSVLKVTLKLTPL